MTERELATAFVVNTIIESMDLYEVKTCDCGKVSVDGGLHYLKRTGSIQDYEELSKIVTLCGNLNE